MLFLVVYHPEGDEPRSVLTDADNSDAAWEAVAEAHCRAIAPHEEELYLDHVKPFDAMLVEANMPYRLVPA